MRSARDELAAASIRHRLLMRRLRRQLLIRIPVAIVLGVGVGLLLRLFL